MDNSASDVSQTRILIESLLIFKPSHLCDAVSRLEPCTPSTASERPNHSHTELPWVLLVDKLKASEHILF